MEAKQATMLDDFGDQSDDQLDEWYVQYLREHEGIDVTDPDVDVSWRELSSGRESPVIETDRRRIQGTPSRFECAECGCVDVLDEFVRYRTDNQEHRNTQHHSRCQCGCEDLERVGDVPMVLGGL